MYLIGIKYFGQVSSSVGINEEVLQFNNPITVSEFREIIINKYPNLKNIQFRIAINLDVADNENYLKDKDELALLPPFAGG